MGKWNWLIGKKKLDLWRFIGTVHIAAAVIGWRRSGKEWGGKLSLAPNLLLTWVSCPVEAQLLFFSPFFEVSSSMWPNRGFRCRLFLTLRMILFCFWNASLFFQLLLWYQPHITKKKWQFFYAASAWCWIMPLEWGISEIRTPLALPLGWHLFECTTLKVVPYLYPNNPQSLRKCMDKN
jgi:hypothetical protein